MKLFIKLAIAGVTTAVACAVAYRVSTKVKVLIENRVECDKELLRSASSVLRNTNPEWQEFNKEYLANGASGTICSNK